MFKIDRNVGQVELYLFIASSRVCGLQVCIASSPYGVVPHYYFLQQKKNKQRQPRSYVKLQTHFITLSTKDIGFIVTQLHLGALVIHVEVPGFIFVLVCNLQPVRMADLLWLEGGVQILDEDHSFRAFGLLNDKHVDVLQFTCVNVLWRHVLLQSHLQVIWTDSISFTHLRTDIYAQSS